jgi:hypothetical protein
MRSPYVGNYLFNSTGESEGRMILVRDRFAEIITTAQTFDAESDGHRCREFGVSHHFAVDIELATPLEWWLRPMTPGKVVPGLNSSKSVIISLL